MTYFMSKLDYYRLSVYSTNLAGTIRSTTLELRDTFIFAITVVVAIVNASCQRRPIDIHTLIPVGIFSDILNCDC